MTLAQEIESVRNGVTAALIGPRDQAAAIEAEAVKLRAVARNARPRVGCGLGGGQIPDTPDASAKLADALAGAGFTDLRMTLLWASVEPRPGAAVTVPAKIVAFCAALVARGIEPLVMFGGTPPQYRPAGQEKALWAMPTPAGVIAYGKAFAAVVAQMPMVKKFEVWNEPNNVFLLGPDKPGGYAALLKSIPPLDRRLTILAGVMCPAKQNPPAAWHADTFLTAWYDADPHAGERYDRLSLHPYTGALPFNTPEPGGWVSTIIPAVQAAMSAAGDDPSRRLIDATETGYQTANYRFAVGEDKQGPLLVGTIETWRSLPYAGTLYLFSWSDFPGATYGLNHADGTPKPALADVRKALTA